MPSVFVSLAAAHRQHICCWCQGWAGHPRWHRQHGSHRLHTWHRLHNDAEQAALDWGAWPRRDSCPASLGVGGLLTGTTLQNPFRSYAEARVPGSCHASKRAHAEGPDLVEEMGHAGRFISRPNSAVP